MYSVKLDETNHFTGAYAQVGTVEGGIYVNELPPDMTRATFYKYDQNTLNWIFNGDKYSEFEASLLNSAISAKVKELGAICSATIEAGIDVTTSYGREHFSLTPIDQSNIKNAYDITKITSLAVLYHADDSVCRTFSEGEITTIYITMMQHITVNTTLCNMLNTWVRRCTTVEEVEAIHYDSNLPEDLADLMRRNLEQAVLVINAMVYR